MNWLTNFVKPKLSSLVKRRDVPEKLWNNCVSCGNMIHHKDLKENLNNRDKMLSEINKFSKDLKDGTKV